MSFRYTRLPTEDLMESGSLTFDYSSAFTYEDNGNIRRKYKSYFTYGARDPSSYSSSDSYSVSATPISMMDRVCYYLINILVYLAFILTFPISIWFSFKIVPSFEKVVVFRWGHLHQTKGPGMVFVMPLVDTYRKIDMRLKAFNVPPQQVITGDGAIIEVGADVYYRIVNPEKSITRIQNLDKSTRVLVQTSLLNLLVRLPLVKIDGHRNSIAENVQNTSNKSSQEWGIEICRLELSQIKILQKSQGGHYKPSVILPPGMASLSGLGAAAESLAGGSVPEALQQLASAFLSTPGQQHHAEEQSMKQPEPVVPGTVLYDSMTSGCGTGGLLDTVPWSAQSTPGPSIRDILQAAGRVLNESLVRKVDAVYEFQLHGEEGSVYFVDLKHGQGQVGEGVWSGDGDVDASLMMTVKDLQLMLTGHLKPFQAYMNGRLRVSGDLAAALRLETFVDKVVTQTKAL